MKLDLVDESALDGPDLSPSLKVNHMAPLKAAKKELAREKHKAALAKLPGERVLCTSGKAVDRERARKKRERKVLRAGQPSVFYCHCCKKYPFGAETIASEEQKKHHYKHDCPLRAEFNAKKKAAKAKLKLEEAAKKSVSREKYLGFNEVWIRDEQNMEDKKKSIAACVDLELKPLPLPQKRKSKPTPILKRRKLNLNSNLKSI